METRFRNGIADLGDFGALWVCPPGDSGRCDVAGRNLSERCPHRASYWWVRRGKRDVSYCEEHARDTFPEAFEKGGAS